MLKVRHNNNKQNFFISKHVQVNFLFFSFINFQLVTIQIENKKNNFLFFNFINFFFIFQKIAFLRNKLEKKRKNKFFFINILYTFSYFSNLLFNKLLTEKTNAFNYDINIIYFQKFRKKKIFFFFFNKMQKNFFNLFNLFFL